MNTLKTRLEPWRSNFNRKAWRSISPRSFPPSFTSVLPNPENKTSLLYLSFSLSIRSPVVTLTCPQKRGTSNIQREQEREKERQTDRKDKGRTCARPILVSGIKGWKTGADLSVPLAELRERLYERVAAGNRRGRINNDTTGASTRATTEWPGDESGKRASPLPRNIRQGMRSSALSFGTY